jgi:hypothetical protein
MPIFHCAGREETEVKESHLCDWTRDRTLDRTRLAHPVSSSACKGSVRTDVFGRSWDQRVRSSSRKVAKRAKSIRRGGASGHVWVLTGIDRTLALWHPVNSSGASGRMVSNANQRRPDVVIASGQFDRRVRSVRKQRQLVPNGSILWVAYKYLLAGS